MLLMRDSHSIHRIKLSTLRRCMLVMAIVCLTSGGGKSSRSEMRNLTFRIMKEEQSTQHEPRDNALLPPITLPYRQLQQCLDDYVDTGRWVDDKWVSRKNPCDFQQWSSIHELTQKFREHTSRRGVMLFTGDSTTRSDLATFTESNECMEKNWDDGAVFQRKGENGTYDCAQCEQAMDIAKCGQPPIVDVSCEGVNLRYVYKVWPWAPLDEIYFSESPEKFQDIDVLVLSNGGWYPWWDFDTHGQLDIDKSLERYLAELRKVFHGPIIFQTEYSRHETLTLDNAVNCTHATCADGPYCPPPSHCAYASVDPRPNARLKSIRKVMERHEIPFIDRWKIGNVLPHAYYDLFYCNKEYYHQWVCNHHLQFVGMMHLSLVENVLSRMGRPTSTW